MVPLGVKASSSTVPSPEMVLCSSTSDLKMIRNGIWRAENQVYMFISLSIEVYLLTSDLKMIWNRIWRAKNKVYMFVNVYKYKSIFVGVRLEDDSKWNLAS